MSKRLCLFKKQYLTCIRSNWWQNVPISRIFWYLIALTNKTILWIGFTCGFNFDIIEIRGEIHTHCLKACVKICFGLLLFPLSVWIGILLADRNFTKFVVSFSTKTRDQNSVKFLYAYKTSSPTDKRYLNETNTDFVHQI